MLGENVAFPSLFGLQFHRLLWERPEPVDRGLRCWVWALGVGLAVLVVWL